ncbi:DnaD domain-containing protein [Macrococcoides caseolyticum]|uniref:DnaD domain-containing protein n=1 Tax=Macrococcoides caseolyticum TaxID=69966 RepID=UPI000C325FDE|nr:DnaD domain protein [Macrococcus caseolyticus]PKF05841.1 DNA replication protein DnaD [Macrococcus caseolyticus]
MSGPIIPGGFTLTPRILKEQEIWEMSPLHLKVYLYLVDKASHVTNEKYERGVCLVTISELQDTCSYMVGYRRERPTKNQINNVLRWLRKTHEVIDENGTKAPMITTTKTTKGMFVKVHGYAFYQNVKNYENHNESHNESETKTTMKTTKGNYHIQELKELKNDNNVVVVPEQKNDFAEVIGLYQSDIQATPPLTVINKLSDDFDLFGKDIMLYAIKKSALAGNRDYRFIDYLTKEWRKQQLKTLEAVEQYEDKRNQPKQSNKYSNDRNAVPNKFGDRPDLSFQALEIKKGKGGLASFTDEERKAYESYYL